MRSSITMGPQGYGRLARPRRGISLFFLLATLVVVSIFAFSTHQMAMHTLRRTRRLVDAQAALFLARSAIACIAGRLQEGLLDFRSDLNRLLLDPTLATGTVLIVDTAPLAQVAEAYREGVVNVRAWVEKIEPLDGRRLTATTGGFDAGERRLWVRIQARAQVGPATTSLTEVREMPIVHLMPGILGKFSLFVRQVERDPLAYNRYANSINGWSDETVPETDRGIPLVLKNGGELDEGTPTSEAVDLWQRRGFIYLGGGKVVLNLTAGNDEGYGENFHFFRMGSPPDIPGFYDADPPPFFAQPPDFSRRHPQRLNTGGEFAPNFAYCLKYVISGFFTSDEFGQGMNVDNRLAVTFSGPPRPYDGRMRSSVLHLYGTRSNPSPTLVLGEVYRRYAEYAGVVVEATGNSIRDAILTYVRETDRSLNDLPPLPSTVEAAPRGDLPESMLIRFDPQEINWKTLFGDETTYKSKMCRVVEEPYLRSHDFLVHSQPDNFEPPCSSFSKEGGKATLQQTFTLRLHPNARQIEPFFDGGDLSTIPPDTLAGKAVYRVPDVSTFCERFMSSDHRLYLDAGVVISGRPGETQSLPSEIRIEKGGLLMLENGHLAIGTIKSGSDPDQVLTCVALNGDILLNPSRGGEVTAILVALRGRVINLNPTRPLDLRGGLCVGELPATSFPRGGRLAWNPLADPSGPDWPLYYRAFLSDFTLEVDRE